MRNRFLLMLVAAVPALCGAQQVAVKSQVVHSPAMEVQKVSPVADVPFKKVNPHFLKHRKAHRPAEVEVVYTEGVADGVQLQVVENERGVQYKRYVKDGKPLTPANLSRRTGVKLGEEDREGASFFENFEGYEGDGYDDWLPDGWVEKNAPGNEEVDLGDNYYNNTWHVGYSDGYFLPMTSDGLCEAFVHFSWEQEKCDSEDTNGNGVIDEDERGDCVILHEAVAQDEWLITPEITVREMDNLYFDLAFDYTSVYKLDWENLTVDRSVVEYNFQVLVREVGAEDWVTLLDIERDSMAQKELDFYDCLDLPFEYETMEIRLADYVGKNIQVAFRHITGVGTGNTTLLDAVMVCPMPLEPLYDRPAGDFIVGMNPEFLSLRQDMLFGPAYTDRVFVNKSATSSDFEWTYQLEEGGELLTSMDKDLVYNAPWGAAAVPVLTASGDGSIPVSYQWGLWDDPQQGAPVVLNGGMPALSFPDGLFMLSAGNYYTSYGVGALRFEDGAYCFGTGSEDYYLYEVEGIVNHFAKPAQPYVLHGLHVALGALEADPDAEFTVAVVETREGAYGQEAGDTLAFATCQAKDALVVPVDPTTDFYTLVFDELMYKDEDGIYSDIVGGLLIDTSVKMVLTGIRSEKVREFAAMCQLSNTPTKESNAEILFYSEYGNWDQRAEDALEDTYTSLCFSLDVEYPFLHADKTTLHVPATGGTAEQEVMSFYMAEAWSVDESALPEWLKVEFVEDNPEDWARLRVTATASPDGQKRECTFVLNALHSPSVEFTVVQDPEHTGVAAVDDAAYRVANVAGAWLLTYPADASQVEVYDANGRLLRCRELTGESTRLPAADLAAGLYLLRFDTGRVVKAVR